MKSKTSSNSLNLGLNRRKKWIRVGGLLVTIVLLCFVVFKAYRQNIIDVDTNKGSTTNTEKQVPVAEESVEKKLNKISVFHLSIDTDKFSVDTDIIEGDTDQDLHKGVVHQKGSAFPSRFGGNVVITGHRWYPGDGEFSKIFENIDKLKKDDKIDIIYNNKKYIYKIINKVIVDTNNAKFLEHTSDPHLTIYTCHPKYTSKQRLVYTSILDSVEDVK